VEQLLQATVESLRLALKEESDLAEQVSDEEWESIRPSTADRRASLLAHIKVPTCLSDLIHM